MLTLHDDPISGNGYKARLLMAFLGTSSQNEENSE